MKLTKQKLHEMISETLNEVSDPEFQKGFQDGNAAGLALIMKDKRITELEEECEDGDEDACDELNEILEELYGDEDEWEDEHKEIKNDNPIHWKTINNKAPEHGSYREGFIMGYGSRWMGIHGTRISLATPPAAAHAADFKDSPSATRKFNKWEL